MLLRQIRIHKKLKQIQVAREIGVSQVTISQWENGASYPQLSKIPKLAKIYGVTADEILHACEETHVQKTSSA